MSMNGPKSAKTLLVVDDEKPLRLMIKAVMQDQGWTVLEAENGLQGLQILKQHPVHVVLADIRMPHLDGISFLSRLQEETIGPPVIMLTAYGSIDSAVEAMKMGAFDYLTKPADNQELIALLNRAAEYGSYLTNSYNNTNSEKSAENPQKMIGESPAMQEVFNLIDRVGPSEATVLIQGESGTGKELVARALHEQSPRSRGPLVKVNCAAIPENLLESELFGYTQGAFSGATKNKPGRFELAEKGTLFLDEIGELPLTLQSKLLRTLQEREVEPLGGIQPVKVDVRILAATNRELEELISAGEFREDLFFRLNVIEIKLPPLRKRKEDIASLAAWLLKRLSRKNKKRPPRISPQFLNCIQDYSWPGNVRELENVLERALILTDGDVLQQGDLPAKIQRGQNTLEQTDSLEKAEREALIQALEKNGYHREKTAAYLGISRRSLQYKLRKFGLARR